MSYCLTEKIHSYQEIITIPIVWMKNAIAGAQSLYSTEQKRISYSEYKSMALLNTFFKAL